MDKKTIQVILIAVVAVALTGSALLITRWYINKPGEPLTRSDGTVIRGDDAIVRGDITPTKTDPPPEALTLEVVNVGPMSGGSMACPGEGGFRFWKEDLEYIAGGYPLNRTYRCRIDDDYAFRISGGGDIIDGVPQWYDIVMERGNSAKEAPLFTIAAPIDALENNESIELARINDFFFEVAWAFSDGSSSVRSAKIIDLGREEEVMDVNWFGERVEIWRDGKVFPVARVTSGCDAASLGVAPQTTGITVAEVSIVNFEPPIIPSVDSLEVGPCPFEPLLSEPKYDVGFFEVRFSFGEYGTVVFDVATQKGHFEMPDGTMAEAWTNYDAGASGFVLSYPAGWEIRSDALGGFCFVESGKECSNWLEFRVNPAGCSDYYLSDVQTRPFTVGDIDGTDFKVRFCDEGSCATGERHVVVCRNGSVYEWVLKDMDNEFRNSIFEKMLSKFSFTSKFKSVQYPPTQARPDSTWPDLGGLSAGFSLRVPGIPIGKLTTDYGNEEFWFADSNRSGDIWKFGEPLLRSGKYGPDSYSCGENFEACLIKIRTSDGSAIITEKTLVLPNDIRGYEIREINPVDGDTRWLMVEYTDKSGVFIIKQTGFSAMLDDVYSRILATISLWTG